MIKARGLRFVLLVSGAVLLAVLVLRNDPAAVAASISQLSWRLLLVVLFPFSFVTMFDTLGWRFAFQRDQVPFWALLSARLAGEAFNLTTPTASVGGEPVKAWLLRRHVPFDESVPSVIVAKTTITIAQGLLLLLGIVVARSTLPGSSPLLTGMEWLLGLEIMAIGGFVVVQMGGVLGRGGRLLGRFGLFGSGERTDTLRRIDGALSHFYRREPRRLLLSIGFHFVGWALGTLETYLILQFLGMPVSFATATVIEAFGTGVRFASFMVPGSLGAWEGGQMASFTALGLGATPALSFSLVRRLREAAWVGIGFIALAALRPTAPAGAALEPEG